ncbi:hypothetical protein BO71DRAFT_418547 [Aspergillus ellipticus CBS 707.79]|uniref:DUF6594 domain-containing protein n=1 Tax=Aspergillus ellipticus CBS 707.79 TaxID=1448320 RepID=A0A319E4F6_9EURO|nr:hypothetical protein BO71DRAFT_418547 [Aspergillus ellipticus CBS 707.79]
MEQSSSEVHDKLADLMALESKSSTSHPLTKLNAKNLLYLQAELAYVQENLDQIIEEEIASGSKETSNNFSSVWNLKGSPTHAEKEHRTQSLKQYPDNALQQAHLPPLTPLETKDLEIFHSQLGREESTIMPLPPTEQSHGNNEKDIVSPDNNHEDSTSFIRRAYNRIISWIYRRWGYRDTIHLEPSVSYYDGHTLISRAYAVNSFISGFLLASLIIGLYLIKDTIARLAAIFPHNVIFVLAVGLMVGWKFLQ